jgi:hypothetical protein
MSGQTTAAQPPPQPLFYKKPEPLTAAAHGKLALSERQDFSFAADAISIPLNAVEVPVAHAYPVVFGTVAPYLPLAVTGLAQGKNLFVEKDGSWRIGTYIPAYVRRYPFALARQEKPGNFTLCIDAMSSRLGTKEGKRLFDGADASEITKNAMQFCMAFEQEMEATRRIMEIVHVTNILVPNQATVTRPNGSSLALTDFLVVDEAKFSALSDAVFLKLRAAGALPLIYGHLASRAVWPELVQRL